MAFTLSRRIISPTLVKTGTGSTSPTGGTDDLLTTGNPIKFTPNVSFVNIRHHTSSFTKRVGIPARRVWDIALEFYMAGSGGAGTTAINGFASIDALLKAAAMNRAAASGTITYTPATMAQLTKCEIWNENHGVLHKAQNAVGNIVFEGVPTDGMKATWTGQGDYAEPTVAAVSGFTGGTDRAQPFLNIAGTVTSTSGTYTPVVSRVRWDRGVRVSEVEDANSSTGLKEVFIEDAEPTMSVSFALDSDASAAITYAEWYADWLAKTTHDFTFTLGTAAANRVQFATVQAQIQRLSLAEGRGYNLINIDYGVTHTTNETEFSIKIF
ncbi:MAG: hypothetical protein AB7P16_22305 [Bradyrhizobium sp.]|uniref:hypothetical protein n=2 Tax=Bradyrhizobium sp. TaxID=376 RepID=UPI003D12A156